MTSIAVSLYFKQENCETLISLYNWGRVKRCQSQLVSYKVEWFCSLVGFSWWPDCSLFFSWSLAVSILALWRAEKRLCWRRPRSEYCIIIAQYNLVSVCSVPTACSSAAGEQAIWELLPPSVLTKSTFFSLKINNPLGASAASVPIYCICPYLHPAEWKRGSFFFILLNQAMRKQQSHLYDNTLPFWSNEDMFSGDIVCSGCKDMVGNHVQLLTDCLKDNFNSMKKKNVFLSLKSKCLFPQNKFCTPVVNI